jgi:hypothetical protein
MVRPAKYTPAVYKVMGPPPTVDSLCHAPTAVPLDCLIEDAPGSTQVERSDTRFHVMDSAGVWEFVRTCKWERCGHSNVYSARGYKQRCYACGRALGE